MLQSLIILALSIALIAVLLGWRRDRRLLFKSRRGPNDIMVFFGEIDRASSSFGGGRLAPPFTSV
jgi:hypothetical protein